MRTLFVMPWLSSSGRRLLISLVTALLLVSGVLALLKISGVGKHASPELVTGSIQRAPAVLRSASDDPMAALFFMRGAINAGDGADAVANSTAQTAAE